MWRELVSQLFDDAKFSPPAAPADIQAVEPALELSLPDDLKGFLLESNGLAAHYGSPLVWSTREMVEQNRLFRSNADFAELYMPFDCLLFFGADVNGDQFAYRVLAGRIRETSWIFKWDHESDNREWFAADLKDFFRRYTLTVSS
jgi:hypothetical protein